MGLTTKKDQRSILYLLLDSCPRYSANLPITADTTCPFFVPYCCVYSTHSSVLLSYASIVYIRNCTYFADSHSISVHNLCGGAIIVVHTNIYDTVLSYADSSLPTGGGGSRAQTLRPKSQELNDHVQRTRTSKREPHL